MHSCTKTLNVLIEAKIKLSSCDIGRLQTQFNKNNSVISDIKCIRKIFGDDLILGTIKTSNGMMYYYLNRDYHIGDINHINEVTQASVGYMLDALGGKNDGITRQVGTKPEDVCPHCWKSYFVKNGKCTNCGESRNV
jgi:hypothetical protein